jgi:ankyrin repeat protein
LLAAENEHEAVVKMLLEKGADLESKSIIGKTPLSLAAANGHETVVKLMLEKGAELESMLMGTCATVFSEIITSSRETESHLCCN